MQQIWKDRCGANLSMTTLSSNGLTSHAELILTPSMKYNFMHFVMLLRKYMLLSSIAES